MKILAIETSCDETGLALIEEKKGKIKVLANLVASQIETHRPWGGVVPHLAKREHQKNLPLLWQQLQKQRLQSLPRLPLQRITSIRSYARDTSPTSITTTPAKKDDALVKNIDLIAVTHGPGLAPCLWAGINFAQELAQKLNKPLVGINHLKGHIFSALTGPRMPNAQFSIFKQNPKNAKFPVLSLIVSGGHTELVYSKKLGHYQIIGETRDDAAGEAFDKIAKLLGLGYPGGPEVSRLAEQGDSKRFELPRPMIHSKNLDFSFSGLKTAVLYLVRGFYPKGNPLRMTQKNIADLCASFEQAVVDVLISKTILAAKKLTPRTIILGGGVAANKKLRRELKKSVHRELPDVAYLLPPVALTGDNALMIALAALAERKILKPLQNPSDLKADPNLRLDLYSR